MSSGNSSASNSTRNDGDRAPLGVYVHVPWCLNKCPYCDFVSYRATKSDIPHARFADAVLSELALRHNAVADRPVHSIFFGGGTPSLLDPRELGRIVKGITSTLSMEADAEVTVECNPTSLDAERASILREAGVNRLSIGIQSLDNSRLKFLGRLHDRSGAEAAVAAAKEAGFERVSGDLMFGVAGGETPEDPATAVAEAKALVNLGLDHVSVYGLTIEPNTRFGELHRQGRLPIASDETMADTFVALADAMRELGFVHYEISNYARPGQESRHNLAYWRGHDYLGLGPAAVGTLTEGSTALRYKNRIDPTKYMDGVEAKRLEHDEEEALDGETRLRERIMLGLRTAEGIDLEALSSSLEVETLTPERTRSIAKLVARGQLTHEKSRLRIPETARAFSDGIAAELF